MKRDDGGELRPPQWELEEGSYDDVATMLADGTITRARAIKLAGAALLGGALTVLWTDEADARRRRKKRRRRKAKVTPNPAPVAPGAPTVLNITNPSDNPLTISGAKLLDSAGNLVSAADLTDPVTIAPHTTVPVTFTFAGPFLTTPESLQLLDGQERPITVVANDGTVLGDVDVVLTA